MGLKPYVIWAPDYRNVSGGIRVLYLLGHLLRERGYQAQMKMTHGLFVGNPWGVPECVSMPLDAVHVYPEIVEGNPSGSDRVVWWLLNRSEKEGVKFVWHPDIRCDPVLNVPYIEKDLFFPGEGERSGVLAWVGKGRAGVVPDGARVITHDWPATRRELADVLRSAEYLISFDAYTALVHEATICGCPVVVLDKGNWNLDVSGSGPMRILGAVDDVTKLDAARAEVGQAHQEYLNYFAAMEEQLSLFISVTQALP